VALDEMDDESRELLVRHFLQGTAQADLAEEIGVSAATMSRRVKHAVAELRRHLAGRGVNVAPGVLMLMCARNGGAVAPKVLMAQLGKMAMVSGAATKSSLVGSIPQWATISFPSPLKVIRAAAKEWPRVSLCAAVGMGLYLAVPYLPLMRFAEQNRPKPAVREEVRPTAATQHAPRARSN
jgi:hypothetical protein